MADLNAIDRLQPCVLDRLFDDEPRQTTEGIKDKIVSVKRFKEGVKRDIEWLLNSKSSFYDLDDEQFAEVKHSVLNYGVRDFVGMSLENLSLDAFVGMIRAALIEFEPRLIPNELHVRYIELNESTSQLQRMNVLEFDISGKIWAEPLPQDFSFRTEISV